MEQESLQDILSRRKEIEQELVEMLEMIESKFTLQHVKDAIFHEEESDDMMKIVAMFDRGGDASELDNVLELVSDAWNYFPHKALGGLSPAEKALECRIDISLNDGYNEDTSLREVDKSIAIIKPKQPFIDWANQLPDADGAITLDNFKDDNTAILIKPYDTDKMAKMRIDDIWEELFENELYGWCTNEDCWPKERGKKLFWKWFDVEFHSVVYDVTVCR